MVVSPMVWFSHQQLIALHDEVAVSMVYLVRNFFANTVSDGIRSNNTSLPLLIYGCITVILWYLVSRFWPILTVMAECSNVLVCQW